jgi:ribosomal protein S18 acetylase RimI-like enzyme
MAQEIGNYIRDAEVSDAEAIARIHVRSWQVAYRGMIPDSLLDNLSVQDRVIQWHKRLADHKESTLVVEAGGNIAGWATFGQSRDDDADARTGELTAIYLDPLVWGRGLGKLLYREIEKRLQQAAFTEVTLWVLEVNSRARRFYSSMGYGEDGTTKSVLREGVEAPETRVRYRKALGNSQDTLEACELC